MDVTIYTRETCPYCIWAKRILQAKGVDFTEIEITNRPALRQEMIERSSRHTPFALVGR